MTKIKNTKKGVAKKTLSMSLVVAMLATSNVPVWAAEFSDDFDAAVATEAPVTEFSDNTIETPAIEEETTEAPMAQAVVESDDLSVDVSVSESAEFTGIVSVSGTINASDLDKWGIDKQTIANYDVTIKDGVATVINDTIKVTYKAAANATGYDVVLGTGSKKENGETRPYQYGNHKKLNLKEGTVTATFKNVPKGTWVVGMHAFNRTSEDGKKVFSPWSNLKKATVK